MTWAIFRLLGRFAPNFALIIKASQQISGAELMMIPAESHLIWFSKYKVEIENRIGDFILK